MSDSLNYLYKMWYEDLYYKITGERIILPDDWKPCESTPEEQAMWEERAEAEWEYEFGKN